VSSLGNDTLYIKFCLFISCLWIQQQINFPCQMFLECYLFDQMHILDQTKWTIKVPTHPSDESSLILSITLKLYPVFF
jgi:hypothetical protein